MLALATLKAVLELSPLNRTSVPPDKTGLAPSESNPTLVPLEMIEVQMLHAVISKFQMPDSDAVSVKTKV